MIRNQSNILKEYLFNLTDLNLLGDKKSEDPRILSFDSLLNYVIKDRVFHTPIEIKNVDSDKLKFSGCDFQSLSFKKIKVKELILESCTIEDTLLFYDCSIDTIIMRNCSNIKKIHIEGACSVGEHKTRFEFYDLKSSMISLSNINISAISFFGSNTNITGIKCNRSTIVEKISLEGNIEYLKIKDLPLIDLKTNGHIDFIDVGKTDSKTLSNLKTFLGTENVTSQNHDKCKYIQRYIDVLIAIYNVCVSQRRYSEADLCLYEIRKCSLNYKIYQAGFGKKILYGIEKFFAEICFGWGIKIFNALITVLLIILAFGVFYFVAARECNVDLNIFKCIAISVNKFFNVSEKYTFLGKFNSIETIVGAILITIVTGILARKLLR